MRDLPPKKESGVPRGLAHAWLLMAQENRHSSRSPASLVPGTVRATVELLSTTTNTDNPELMAGVMATLPTRVQVDMLKAIMEGALVRHPCPELEPLENIHLLGLLLGGAQGG